MAPHDWLLYGPRASVAAARAADRHLGPGGDKLPEDEKLLCIRNASKISGGVYGKPVAALSAINNGSRRSCSGNYVLLVIICGPAAAAVRRESGAAGGWVVGSPNVVIMGQLWPSASARVLNE